MRRSDAGPRLDSRAARLAPAQVRALAGAFAGLSLIATVWAAAVFVRWSGIDDAIYFPAVETGRTAVFPPGHFQSGWFAATATAVLGASTVLLSWVAFVAARRPVRSAGQGVVLVLGAAMLGAAVPGAVRYSVLGMVPLMAGAGLLALAILWPVSRQ